MKKIINGKIYDTTTAQEIASDGFSSPGDFHYWEEILYRTPKGNYFFYGEGGPMSHYAKNVGNNTTSGSSTIWAVSEEEAQKWLAKVSPNKALELFPGLFEEA
ncbi:MAG: hypothetical protein AB1397_02985 [bacterium]